MVSSIRRTPETYVSQPSVKMMMTSRSSLPTYHLINVHENHVRRRHSTKSYKPRMHLDMNDAITDSGATQIFVMDRTPVVNKCLTTHPLKVALVDGRIVLSTHIGDIQINGLPTVLTGHIIPDLSIASLFGIHVLTEAGCTVTFDKMKCIVRYNIAVISNGTKDPATDLWTLPLGSLKSTTSHHFTE